MGPDTDDWSMDGAIADLTRRVEYWIFTRPRGASEREIKAAFNIKSDWLWRELRQRFRLLASRRYGKRGVVWR